MSAYHRYFGLTVTVIAFIGALFLATIHDGPVPVHWNAAGEIDGFSESSWGLLIIPCAMLGLFAIFQVIEKISPQGYRIGKFTNVVGIFQNATLLFLSLVLAAQMLATSGIDVRMDQLMYFGTGTLFIVVGNFLAKTRKNFFIGIRTPWTLASDEVWLRTHRLGGWLFVIGGFILLYGGVVTTAPAFMISVVATIALVPVVYSFVLYRRLEGFRDGDAPND